MKLSLSLPAASGRAPDHEAPPPLEPVQRVPMSATEKAQRAAGFGATSGYWKHADAHRRALLEPMPKGTISRDD